MTFAIKTALAAAALGIGFAASPVSAQVGGYDRATGYDRSYGDASRTAPGYDEDGALNVFGARIDPRRSNGGIVGGIGNTVGGVVGGVGNVVGGVVGGVTGAADDITTGSLGNRDVGYTAQRGGRYAR